MKNFVFGTVATLSLLFVATGCGEGDPEAMNPEDVPAVPQQEIQDQLNRPEMQQSMPPGAQIPEGVLPQESSGQ